MQYLISLVHELLFLCTSYQQLTTTYELLTCGKAAGFEIVRWWRLFVFFTIEHRPTDTTLRHELAYLDVCFLVSCLARPLPKHAELLLPSLWSLSVICPSLLPRSPYLSPQSVRFPLRGQSYMAWQDSWARGFDQKWRER